LSHPITINEYIIVQEFYGHGKVLLTGEYGILDGAKAIALPTQFGQKLKVKKIKSSDLMWESINADGEKWFEAQISLYDFSSVKTTNQKLSDYLQNILKNTVRLNSDFLSKWNGFRVTTELEFDKNWGLGSSSTLTYLIAKWADVNPLLLHFKISEGSGYDVACAGAEGPIQYSVQNDEVSYNHINFNPAYRNKLYFVYLGNKVDSNISVRDYLKNVKGRKKLAREITKITDATLECSSFGKFAELVDDHENIMSKALDLPKVKDKLFKDYWHCVKSLGAWGGDFALVLSEKPAEETKEYFAHKGHKICIPYDEFVLQSED